MSASHSNNMPPKVRAALAHRGGLAPDLKPAQTLFSRIGGRPVIEKVIDALYDRIEMDDELRPMFTRTLAPERRKQKAFFEEWMGGEPQYTQHHAYGGIRNRHGHIHITRRSAERWLEHIAASLHENIADGRVAKEALRVLRPLAMGLVNEAHPPPNPGPLRSIAKEDGDNRRAWRPKERR